MTFDDIMNYCPDNKSVYSNLLKTFENNNIVPFVGAGMSVPLYPTWPKTLEELVKKINSEEKRTRIISQIPDSPQTAADQIAEVRSLNVLLDDMREIFQKERITSYDRIETMAAWLLPMLFPQAPVITTNYDSLLEYIFKQNGREFQGSLTPSRLQRWEQSKQKNLHYLYKVHGDLDDETEEDIIFTATQYREKYDITNASNKGLSQELTEWFSGRVLLFLGCSLEKDNTVDILQKLSCNRRITHYAILPCEQGEKMDDRTRELGILGIRAIFYPKDKHEAVRVILETLLYSTDPKAYHLLKNKQSSLTTPANTFPFVHNSGKVDFISRAPELEALHNFLDDERGILWWAVTGAGGCGKTRLADQLELEVSTSWDVFRINDCNLSLLQQENPCKSLKPQLYILDYIFSNTTAIGKWIAKVSAEDYPCKLRFLILDRPIRSKKESLHQLLTENLTPKETREIESKCYASVYQLQPLSPVDLKEIMNSYIYHQTGNRFSEQELNVLYHLLEQIDKGLIRPLFALFIAEAAISDPHVLDPGKLPHWSQKEVLDFIVERELRLLNNILQSMESPLAPPPRQIYQAVEKALAFASMTGGISIKEYCDQVFPEDGILINQFCQSSYDRGDFFKELKISDEQELLPLKPDIIGEYLILHFLSQQPESFVKEFVGKAWWYPKKTAETMRRIISDFDFSDKSNLIPIKLKRQLENIEIADGIQEIRRYAFHNCTFLKSIRCPDSIESINASAFQNCVSLNIVRLPDGLTHLSRKLFANCISLTSLRLPAHLESISSEVFRNCRSLTLLEGDLPDSLIEICRGAFQDCISLKSISIPSGLRKLAANIFNNCSSLETVYWKEDSRLTSIKTRAFHGCCSLKTVQLPNSVTEMGRSAFEDCKSITDVRCPDQIEIINDYTFKNCENLKTIHLPNDLKEIGIHAFENCIRLQHISFDNKISCIGSYAFYRCHALEKADLPFGVKYIGIFAFADCSSLSFPDGKINVRGKIGQYAFRNCISLKEIWLPNQLKEITEGSFEGCSSLSAITLPKSLLSIRKYAFSSCSSLEKIDIPESVQRIYPSAFARSGIKKILFPASVLEVKDSAFGDCIKLTEVIIQNPNTVIGPNAFCGCSLKVIQGAKWQRRRIQRGSKQRYHEIPLTKRSNVGTNILLPKRKPKERPDLALPDTLK